MTEEHIRIDERRFIMVPKDLQRIAVQFDHNVETVTFDCPRYADGLDMSKMRIFINYMCPDKSLGMYLAQNVTIDEEDDSIMHFDWTISRNVTKVKGPLSFLVCVKKTDEFGLSLNHWNSELNQEMYVSEGLECEEPVLEAYADIISYILTRQDFIEGKSREFTREHVDEYFQENPFGVDDTLSQTGLAADAKVVGDEVARLDGRIDETNTRLDNRINTEATRLDGRIDDLAGDTDMTVAAVDERVTDLTDVVNTKSDVGHVHPISSEVATLFGLEASALPDDVFAILAQRNVQNFVLERITSSRTWVAPKAAEQLFKVFVVGGGGGGGTDEDGLGGGGGGGYVEIVDFTIAEGSQITVICGAGGTANTDGGTTTFGDLLSAAGGKCGNNRDTHGNTNGGDGGAGGGAGSTTGNGGNGGTYGGGGGGSKSGTGGNGGMYGGNGGPNAGSDGTKDAVFTLWQSLFEFGSMTTSGRAGASSGGGGGYGGNGGDGYNGVGGGGGGYGGNGGRGHNPNTTGDSYPCGGGGGSYGGNGGDGHSNGYGGGGGGGGFFCNGATGSSAGGGGGGGFFANGSGRKGGKGGVLVMYIKED